MNHNQKTVLVLASTFPRWKNDSTPPFTDLIAANRKLIEKMGFKK